MWWKGDGGQVGWFIWGYESLWLPASLLENDAQQRLADALFASSRYSGLGAALQQGTRRSATRRNRRGEGHRDESRGADRLRAGDRRPTRRDPHIREFPAMSHRLRKAGKLRSALIDA